MSYETVRELQRTLYRAAKADGDRRFHSLRDKLYRPDVLERAWELVKRNKGSYGVDRRSIADIEAVGVEAFLAGITTELREGTYRVSPVRRVHIPKPGKPGKTRPLSIPTVKDRVVQQACRLVIEPIFEAQFLPNSFGFRPRRSAKDASLAIWRWLNFGCVHVVDADIADCFGSIDKQRLVALVERRVADGYVLALIRAWLRAGIMEQDRLWHNHVGVPQGGPISPVLANIYLHELDRTWVERGYERPGGLDAKLIRYADDSAPRTLKEVRCRRRYRRMRCCTRDEGAGRVGWWPFAVALQGEAANHREVRRSRAGVLSLRRWRAVSASGVDHEGERKRTTDEASKAYGWHRNRGRVVALG